jgi:hypothetical protein
MGEGSPGTGAEQPPLGEDWTSERTVPRFRPARAALPAPEPAEPYEPNAPGGYPAFGGEAYRQTVLGGHYPPPEAGAYQPEQGGYPVPGTEPYPPPQGNGYQYPPPPQAEAYQPGPYQLEAAQPEPYQPEAYPPDSYQGGYQAPGPGYEPTALGGHYPPPEAEAYSGFGDGYAAPGPGYPGGMDGYAAPGDGYRPDATGDHYLPAAAEAYYPNGAEYHGDAEYQAGPGYQASAEYLNGAEYQAGPEYQGGYPAPDAGYQADGYAAPGEGYQATEMSGHYPPPEADAYQADAYQADAVDRYQPTGMGPYQATGATGAGTGLAAYEQTMNSAHQPEMPAPAPSPAPQASAVPAQAGSDVVRVGPGVPPSQAGAESVWRTGRPVGPPPRQARMRRMRRWLGLALTLALLIAAGVVLWLRFFNHPALSVSEVTITQQLKSGCALDVTGKITTNGSAGTISYQWVYQPQNEAPQPLNQSLVAGQKVVYVTVAVQGQGHGAASQQVTLDVLGPNAKSDTINVNLSC